MAENSLFLSGIEELKKRITELGMPAFRCNQIRDWIFKKFVCDICCEGCQEVQFAVFAGIPS